MFIIFFDFQKAPDTFLEFPNYVRTNILKPRPSPPANFYARLEQVLLDAQKFNDDPINQKFLAEPKYVHPTDVSLEEVVDAGALGNLDSFLSLDFSQIEENIDSVRTRVL